MIAQVGQPGTSQGGQRVKAGRGCGSSPALNLLLPWGGLGNAPSSLLRLAASLVVFSPAAADGAKNSLEQGSGGSALDFPEVYWYSGLVTPV